jgi:hypothetical protein
MSKIPVYFMPGLAASTAILKNTTEADFEVHLLEWEIPRPDESLAEYAKELPKKNLKIQF